MKRLLLVGCILFASANILAHADTLDSVESQVYQTQGTQSEIAIKGKTCIAQVVRSDSNATPINDADIQGGTIVASSQMRYSLGLGSMAVRSTLTFMAKDGRFKILHDNIRSLSEYGANPIYKGWGTHWKNCEDSMIAESSKIADCVMKSDNAKNNW
jgi:hypothetical protein